MKPTNHKTLITILFLLFAMQGSCILGQNVIQLHRKDGRHKDYIVKPGRSVRIVTNEKQEVKGKISEIKDSSVIVEKNAIEVPKKQIDFFYCRKDNFGNFFGANCFIFLTSYATYYTIDAITAMGPGFAIALGIISLPVPYIGTLYFLLHKKKYDVQTKYDLKIVKAQ